MKKVFNLIDGHFAHDKYSVAARDSKHIEWDRSLKNVNSPTFYSHMKMFDIDKIRSEKELSYGWVFESQGVEPICYQSIEQIISKFNKAPIVFFSRFSFAKLKASRYVSLFDNDFPMYFG